MSWLDERIPKGKYTGLTWREKFGLFFEQTEKDDCWNWNDKLFKNGYGCFRYSRLSKLAHRVSYEIAYGVAPGNLQVLHRCDNRRCVNPNHLFLGSQQDNMDDMDAKNRRVSLRGVDSPVSKLTESQVVEIRRLFNKCGMSAPEVSKVIGISEQNIRSISHFESWKHVGGDKPDASVEKHRKGLPKFTPNDVLKIRQMALDGVSRKEIAMSYSVTKGAIDRIINRKNWKHVE